MEELEMTMIEQCSENNYAGKVTFGEVIGVLVKAGVESYHADFRTHDTTYYLPHCVTHVIKSPVRDVKIAPTLDTLALQAAIQAAQRDEVRYPEFLQLAMAAGCVGYIVWITGRHVIYFGHRGETHIEPFPNE